MPTCPRSPIIKLTPRQHEWCNSTSSAAAHPAPTCEISARDSSLLELVAALLRLLQREPQVGVERSRAGCTNSPSSRGSTKVKALFIA